MTATARLDLEYDGTGFSGWAAQPGRRTVQATVEEALRRICGRACPLTVAGRTDAGVHARGQVASHAGEPAPAHGLNAVLPPDVRVLASVAASEGFDARRDAVARMYRYRVLESPVERVFERGRALHVRRPLDREALDRCAAMIAGVHDFTAFTPSGGYHRRFEREVTRSEWLDEPDGVVAYWIEADTFMRGMVRALVGTMLDVSAGRLPADHLSGLLKGRPRAEGGETARPHGLYLERVRY